MLLGQEVRAVNGKGHLEAVTVEDLHSGGRRRLAAGALVVLIGATPTPIGWQQDRLDPNGFGRDPFLLETSRPGVSAVGDVRAGGAGANGSGHLCAGAQSVHQMFTPHRRGGTRIPSRWHRLRRASWYAVASKMRCAPT